ncbi:hypothetical protein [Argonema antarcticum]|uniref:hypothetical protein n=1 Tax=Argonema antarcticum TaxID=2942763 RepID=UPI0020125EAE|nr:hypothetical protein [Argonema antarcticum]MCL1474025.1 hypothetical protein [Argonema antarcticum A004/B2]
MNAHRIETTFAENGKITLDNLPFVRGDAVEIIILESPRRPHPDSNSYPLEGKVCQYDDPH